MKTAVALFLKNENQNILSWLAWHIAIGINKFFIYDDYSTDGTYEILQAASNIYDVELEYANKENGIDFYWRQADAFKQACQKAIQQKFDWIAFLDADEFISLEKDLTIQEFLKRFSSYNGISLNWRLYSGSNRVFKTKLPTYEAYTWHADKDLGDAVLTKCFIRPETYSFEYINPHHFKTIDDNYADSCGNAIQEKRSHSETIIWDIACINHYINRSMEDYIERIRNRLNADQLDSTIRWDHFNRSDIYRTERKDFIEKANEIILTIKKECVRNYIFDLTGFLQKNHKIDKPIQIFSFQTPDSNNIGIHQQETFLYHSQEQENFTQIFGIVYEESPNFIYLFQQEKENISNIPFSIRNIEKFSAIYPFLLEPIQDTPYYCLKSLMNKQYMSFVPTNGTYKTIEVNRQAVSNWEYISLQKETSEISFNISPHKVHDLYSFFDYINRYNEDITYEDFILAYNLLSVDEQKTLLQQKRGRIISWL